MNQTMGVNAQRMLRRLGLAVAQAYREVEADAGLKASISLTITVAREKDVPELTSSNYKLKVSTGDAGDVRCGKLTGQIEFDLDPEDEDAPEDAEAGARDPGTDWEYRAPERGPLLLESSEYAEDVAEGERVPAGARG